MNAIEARKKADEINAKKFSDEHDKIIVSIIDAVNEGKCEIVHYGVLNNGIKEILEMDGFKIQEKKGGINETDTHISC